MKDSNDEFSWLTNPESNSQDCGYIKLYDGPLIEGAPIIEGQIKTPSQESISAFRVRYLPLIESVFKGDCDYRVLEVGAGLGNATYGVSQTLSPSLYIASEPFVSLLKPLRANMDLWGLKSPTGVVAAYDANFVTRIKLGAVNLIVVNSVLHHILHWRKFLKHVVELLDSPGLAVFGEPNREAWIYLITIIRSFMSKYGNGSSTVSDNIISPRYIDTVSFGNLKRFAIIRSFMSKYGNGSSTVSDNIISPRYIDTVSFENLKRFVNSIELRIARKDDLAFMSTLEDKHIFSWFDLLEFCNEQGVELRISKVEANWKASFINRMRPIFASDHSLNLFCEELDLLTPTGLEEGLLAEVFSVFGIYKNKK